MRGICPHNEGDNVRSTSNDVAFPKGKAIVCASCISLKIHMEVGAGEGTGLMELPWPKEVEYSSQIT